MKSVFDMILMVIISFMMIFCMVIFCDEVLIRQQGIHLRNKINELVEINSGYTDEVDIALDELLEDFNYDYSIEFSKDGQLEYGEKLIYVVTIYYERNLPFYDDAQLVEYTVTGQYFNIN